MYIGQDLQVAYPNYTNIDDISGSFNGVTTSFALTVGGVAPVPNPARSNQCIISVGGVLQRPDDTGSEGFRLSGGNIVFSSAPSTGEDFFGVILAGSDYVNVGANFPSGTAAVPSITFDTDLDTGIYNPAANQLGFVTGGVSRINIDSSGSINIDNNALYVDAINNRVGIGTGSPNALLHVAGDAQVNSLNSGPLAGTRNRVINGEMVVDQRNAGAGQTFTAAAALAYSVDRWYGYCTGANVTGQRVQGATVGQFRYRFTGAASVTAIGFGQRIEQLNSADLAGTTATLSVDLANSVLTTVTWTAYYANTVDAFGTLASPTRTQIATGTFTVSSTVTRYNTNISIPAAATTGIEIVFTVGAQTSGTWTIGNVQLEPGTVATPFERRSYGQELALCQRYYETMPSGARIFMSSNANNVFGANANGNVLFKVDKRATPTVTFSTTGNSGSGISTSFTSDVTTFSFVVQGVSQAGDAYRISAFTASAEL